MGFNREKDCKATILEMIDIIPKEMESLIGDLRDDYEFYVAENPEERLQWRRTIGTLYRHVPRPAEDWECSVVALFTGKTPEEVRRNQERIHGSNKE